MVKRKQSQPRLSADAVRGIGLAVIFILFAFFSVRGIWLYAKASGLFTIQKISVAENLAPLDVSSFEKLKGKNIFAVNLGELTTRIKAKYPAFANLKVLRRFPDEILISGLKRSPFAVVSVNGRSIMADSEGYLIGSPKADDEPLTVVRGLKVTKTAAGSKLTDERFEMARQIISEFRKDRLLSVVPLQFVDMSDVTRIVSRVGAEDTASIDVILDAKSFSTKVGELGTLFSRNEIDLLTVKYIDLRFEAPIIGQKKTKK